MRSHRPNIRDALLRCVNLLCPACGQASIIKRPFHIAHKCSVCGVVFTREEGFFVGAILVAVVTTEVVILITYLVLVAVLNIDWQYALTLLFVVAVTFPILFYHHSWSLWLTFDHYVESLPKS